MRVTLRKARCACCAIGRLPTVRQEFFDAARRVRLDAGEHVGWAGDGVDAVLLAGRDPGVEPGEVVTGFLVPYDARATAGTARRSRNPRYPSRLA
jgi:hypothetical protein